MNRRALVTGGSTGVGAAIAERFVSAGMEVHVVDIVRDRLDEFCARTGAVGHVADVADFAGVARTLAAVCEQYGVIEILVNNAGITRDAFVHKMARE